MNKKIFFKVVPTIILIFYLLQIPLAYSESWSVCNESNVGTIKEITGNTYICARENGEFEWVTYAAQPSGTTLLILLFLVAIAVFGLLLLKNKKIKKLKNKKIRKHLKLR